MARRRTHVGGVSFLAPLSGPTRPATSEAYAEPRSTAGTAARQRRRYDDLLDRLVEALKQLGRTERQRPSAFNPLRTGDMRG